MRKETPEGNGALRRAREERGWTQRDLAEKLQVSEQTVASWERLKRFPSPALRKRLCELLEKSPEELRLQPAEQKCTLPSDDATSVFPLVVNRAEQRQEISEQLARKDKNRWRMLKRVEMRWITDVLEHSLYKKAFISLSLRERPEAVENPWRDVVQEAAYRPAFLLPPASHIHEIYDEADGALLILGEPGAGKTTLLLELASTLLKRARNDDQHPIPVVFNLSEWSVRRQPLQEWLVQELHGKYQVPGKLAQAWIEAEQVLLLLDGLDEVAPDNRAACIRAINAYRETYGLVPLVVCCRSADYFSQPARLLLNRAVAIQPLTTQQVHAYIAQLGPDLASLQLALQHDPALQEVASTPLMLNTLAVVYQGVPPDEFLASGSLQMRRNTVFAKYVERVLELRGPKKIYTTEQIRHYLGWLAHHMQSQNQAEFYVEHLQPDWLENEKRRHAYRRTVIRLITIVQCIVAGALASWLKGGLKNGVVGSGNGILGLFGGGPGNSMLGWMSPGIGGGTQGGASLIIIVGIVVWLVSILIPGPSLPSLTPRAVRHGLVSGVKAGLQAGIFTTLLAFPSFTLLNGIAYGISYGLGIGFFIGMCTGLLYGLASGLRYEQRLPREKIPFCDRLVDGLLFGAGGFCGFVIVGLLLRVSVQSTFIYGTIAGLFFLLAYGFGGGSSLFPLDQAITPAEIVSWSWRQMARDMKSNARKSVTIALVTILSVSIVIAIVSSSFFFNIIYGVRYGLVFGIISGLIVGIAGLLSTTLKSGWSSDTLPEDQHTTPNEGIARSGRNALIGACIFAPIGGIASGLACGVGFGLVGGLSTWPVMSMAFAVMLTIMFFIISAIAHGLVAWVEHYTLRWYLWRAGCIPLNYIRFLNAAAKYVLMRKVGGGYMFIHRLVLEYFAHLYQSEQRKRCSSNKKREAATFV